MKKEFRKYEEQAQLEILKLKEGISKMKEQIKVKAEDMATIGDKYIELEEKHSALQIEFRHKQSLI